MSDPNIEVFRHQHAQVFLRREPWDCAQLRLNAGKIENLDAPDDVSASHVVASAVAAARKAGFAHLASRVSTTDRRAWRALQSAGFRLVDTVVHFSMRRAPTAPLTSLQDLEFRWADQRDAPAIGDLAAASFSDEHASFNRYLNDAGFSQEQVRRVYDVWGKTSVAGEAADMTRLALRDGVLLGFLTVKLPGSDGIARVPLNAVASTHRGQGVYGALVNQAAHHIFSMGAKRLDITTQVQQLAVQRTWLRMGGTLEGSSHSFHLWL